MELPLYLGNVPTRTGHLLQVDDKFTLAPYATVHRADRALIETAIGLAAAASPGMAALPHHRRRDILMHLAAACRRDLETLAQTLCAEVGKPIRDARTEVARAIDTLELAAAETTRSPGEVVPMDATERGTGYRGFWQRMPVGPCALITPFNFPLLLAAHKLGPALAAGCPFVWKPASTTPVSALLFGAYIAEAGLPAGAFSILPSLASDAECLATDPRIRFLSFTGSPAVGFALKAKSGRKRVGLELGGNAAVLVHQDADLEYAVERIAFGAFYQSGQSCISVQRILVHEAVAEAFTKRLVTRTNALPTGDPRDQDTVVGPLIAGAEADRVMTWIDRARDKGAKVLCGGTRDGHVVAPTLLTDVPATDDLCAEEAFGPVAVLQTYRDFDTALREVNASRFGLQAGVFTADIGRAFAAFERLDVGGVVIGDVPSFRADQMPYGGVKDSGVGREGVRFAIEEMTEIRMLVFRIP